METPITNGETSALAIRALNICIGDMKKQILQLECNHARAAGRRLAHEAKQVDLDPNRKYLIDVSCETDDDVYLGDPKELQQSMKLKHFINFILMRATSQCNKRTITSLKEILDTCDEGTIIDIGEEGNIGYFYVWRNTSNHLMVTRTLGEHGMFLPCYAIPFLVKHGLLTYDKIIKLWPAIRGIVIDSKDKETNYRDFPLNNHLNHYPYFDPLN